MLDVFFRTYSDDVKRVGYEQCLQSRSLGRIEKTDVDVGVRLSQLRYTPKTESWRLYVVFNDQSQAGKDKNLVDDLCWLLKIASGFWLYKVDMVDAFFYLSWIKVKSAAFIRRNLANWCCEPSMVGSLLSSA